MARLTVIPKEQCPHCGRTGSPHHEPIFVAGNYAGCYEPKKAKERKGKP